MLVIDYLFLSRFVFSMTEKISELESANSELKSYCDELQGANHELVKQNEILRKDNDELTYQNASYVSYMCYFSH